MDKDKKTSLELIRFVITGCACAALDLLVCFLVKEALFALTIDWLKTAIYTLCGFIAGVILNYIMSTFWVFKNVEDKNKSKTKLFIFLFVVLSAVGWVLSWGTMELCTFAFIAWWNIDIGESLFAGGISFTLLSSLGFWLFVVAFILKTFIGMVWNYLTRKFILYKAPKENKEENQVEESLDE